MIQFVKFHSVEVGAEGVMMVLATDISAIIPSNHQDVSVLITKHGNYQVAGNAMHFIEALESMFGGLWDAIPATSGEPG